MKVTVQSVHKTSPRFDDVDGPFDASPNDFATLENARKWFAKHRIKLGRVTWRKEGNRWVFFPASRMASSAHALIVRPGASKRLKGREIAEMAQRLKQKGYSQPGMYARKLYREGIRLHGRWIDEAGPEGHLQGGGLGRSGRRNVSGVTERLWAPRGGLGSLEQTHGFRDARDATKRRHTMADIRRAAKIAGNHFFARGQSSFFGGDRFSGPYQGPGGLYFVNSNAAGHMVKRVTLHPFDIDTVHRHSATHADARTLAKSLAKGTARDTFRRRR